MSPRRYGRLSFVRCRRCHALVPTEHLDAHHDGHDSHAFARMVKLGEDGAWLGCTECNESFETATEWERHLLSARAMSGAFVGGVA